MDQLSKESQFPGQTRERELHPCVTNGDRTSQFLDTWAHEKQARNKHVSDGVWQILHACAVWGEKPFAKNNPPMKVRRHSQERYRDTLAGDGAALGKVISSRHGAYPSLRSQRGTRFHPEAPAPMSRRWLTAAMTIAVCIAAALAWALLRVALRPHVIAAIPRDVAASFSVSEHAGLAEAAARSGFSVYWNGPRGGDDTEQQIRLVDRAIDRRVASRGLCSHPPHRLRSTRWWSERWRGASRSSSSERRWRFARLPISPSCGPTSTLRRGLQHRGFAPLCRTFSIAVGRSAASRKWGTYNNEPKTSSSNTPEAAQKDPKWAAKTPTHAPYYPNRTKISRDSRPRLNTRA